MPPAWTQAGESQLGAAVGAAVSEGGGSLRANLRIGTAALVAVKVGGADPWGVDHPWPVAAGTWVHGFLAHPTGEHASIGARRYRARTFFASVSPAPLPHRLD